jgi:MFS family permease
MRRLFRGHRFRVFYASQVVSDLGTAVSSVGLAFAVLDKGSATDLGWVMAARVLPLLAVLLVGGVWVDRLSRERVLVWANLASFLSLAATAALILTGTATVWELVLLSFVTGAAATIRVPAAGALLPSLVDADLLHRANAVGRVTTNTTTVLGSALGGLLAALVDPGWAIALDAASFLVTALLLSRLPVRRPLPEARTSFLRELRDGWSAFTAQTWLWPVVLQFVVINLVWSGAYTILGPLVARERLGGAAAWGTILAANSAGMILGGVIALRWHPRHPMRVGVPCVIALAAPLAGQATTRSVWLIAALALAAGLFMEIFEVNYAVSFQTHVPAPMLARVSSYDGLVSLSITPLGYALAGPLATTFGTGPTTAASAVLIVLASLAVLLVPAVRSLGSSRVPG